MLRKSFTMFFMLGFITVFLFSGASIYAATGDPGRIEAENYFAMSGIQTEGCTEGGLNVGYVDAGDWMDYRVNIPYTTTYMVEFRVSSPYSGTRFQLRSGSNVLTELTVPNTGGWQNWQTISASVTLNAGSQTLRVYAVTNGWNLNWINITRSSASNKVMDFEILNGTRGTYSNSEIYWAVLGLNADNRFCYMDANGNLVPVSYALNDAPGHLTKNGQNYANIYHKLSEVPLVSVPNISSGRMYLSVGSPCYIKLYDNGFAGPDVNNPTDPNNDVYWDFVEFTINDSGYHGNTTRVDGFGFPITHRLICSDGYDRTVGETETRAALFSAYLNEVPNEFKTLVQAPYRILAPCKGEFKAGGLYANYFDSYVNQVWHESLPKPTTQDILLGIGSASNPEICAALNRGVYMDTAHRADSNYFYQITPCNYYSKFWHDHSIDGLSYGFCYDDVNGFAAYLEHNNPVKLVITVGW